MTSRSDRLTAAHVDMAVNLARSHGVATGARLLFELGLSLDLARRVLLQPGRRRGAVTTAAERTDKKRCDAL